MLDIQHDAHGHFGPFEAQHAKGIEAAEVRADEQDALAGGECFIQRRQAVRANVEATEALAEQEEPIEDRRGEAVNVAIDVPRRGAPPENAIQIEARCAPLRPASQEEVERRGPHEELRDTAAAASRDPHDHAQPERVADLAALFPRGAHGEPTCSSAKVPCATG